MLAATIPEEVSEELTDKVVTVGTDEHPDTYSVYGNVNYFPII